MATTNVIVSPDRKLIVMPYRPDVAGILNSAGRRFDHNGSPMLAVPHDNSVVKLLRNMQIDAPAPILSYYDWAGDTPFESQKTTAAMLTLNSRAYVLSSMGVGKTRAALYAFDYLKKLGLVKRMLVVAPLSTLVTVWEREIFTTFSHLQSIVLHGTRPQRLERLRDKFASIFIINHDGVKVCQHALLNKNFDVVVIDELASYRNDRTDRWKKLHPIVKDAAFAWGMTGAPTPNAPTDAYGQVKLLTPSRVPFSFRGFKMKTMKQVSAFRWVARQGSNNTVHQAMQPAVRFSLDECHDLPPLTYSTREIGLNKKQKAAYKSLMDTYAADIRAHKLTVVNEAGRLNKLLQIGCGFAYTDDGKGLYIDASVRLKLVLELIQEAEGKVIVFAPFKFAVRMLDYVISKKYSTKMITGGTSKKDRDHIFTQFRQSRDPHIIVAQPGCMSHGLTLVEASHIVWYAPIHSSETYAQANARIHRPGQTRHTHIVHIQSNPIEKRIYGRLMTRQKVQGVLLDMFRNQETDEWQL